MIAPSDVFRSPFFNLHCSTTATSTTCGATGDATPSLTVVRTVLTVLYAAVSYGCARDGCAGRVSSLVRVVVWRQRFHRQHHRGLGIAWWVTRPISRMLCSVLNMLAHISKYQEIRQ